MTRWNDGLKSNKIKISKTKTEVINISRNRRHNNIRMEKQQLKQVENFKYLEAMINKNNPQEKEITNGITKYNKNLLLTYNRQAYSKIKQIGNLYLYTYFKTISHV